MKYLSVVALLCCFLITFSSCNKEDGEELSNTQNTTELAEKRYFEPFCLTCDGIDVSIEKTGEEDGCCEYKVTVDHKDKCGPGTRHHIFEDGVWVGNITTENTEFKFEVCDGKSKVITIDGKTDSPSGPYDDICFSQTLSCACDCESTDLSFDLLETEIDGCCIYAINATVGESSDDNMCGYILSLGEESYPLSGGTTSIETNVCVDQILSAQLYQGEILCQEVEIECTPEPLDFCDYFTFDYPNIVNDSCCFEFTTISDALFIVDFMDNNNPSLVVNKEKYEADIDGTLIICVPAGQHIIIYLETIGPDTTLTPEEINEINSIPLTPQCSFNC